MSERLDLRGLRCPLPVLRLEARMRRMASGETVAVIADDPLARIDLPHAASGAGFVCVPLEDAPLDAFGYAVTAPLSGKDEEGDGRGSKELLISFHS